MEQLGLPFPNWRKNQWELIKATAEGRKNNFMIQAPAGYGKSGMAVGLLRHTGETGVILVRTKQLQDQYEQSFPGLVTVLKGKGNYQCIRDPQVTADIGVCSIGLECEVKPECPYWNAKRRALGSQITVLNYTLFLLEANFARGAFSGRQWLILDECHLAELELMKLVSAYIPLKALQRDWPFHPNIAKVVIPLLRGAPVDSPSPAEWVGWAKKTAVPFIAHLEDLVEQARKATDVDLLVEIAATKEFVRRLQRLLLVTGDWLIQKTNRGVRFRPVWVGGFGQDYYFRHARKHILMSATILSPTMMAKTLGIPTDDVSFYDIPSTFDPANRPIFYWPVAKLKIGEPIPDEYYQTIDKILEKHKHQKGLIHTANFDLRDKIMARSRWRYRFLTHGPEPKLLEGRLQRCTSYIPSL